MTVIAYGFLFAKTAQNPDGQFSEEAYRVYGVLGSALIFISIMASALGTHSRIPHLQAPPPKRKLTPFKIFAEIFETLSDRSFVALFVAALFSAIATGVSASLAFTHLAYFWEFSEGQITIWTLFVFVSALIGAVIAPPLSKRFGKKKAVIRLGLIAFTIAPLPYVLRLAGLLPPNGDPALFPLILVIIILDLGMIIGLQALFASMIADLVEHSQVKTGRRSEGVFFAAVTFTRKTTQGLGVLAAGFVLSFAAFPENARPGEVPEDALFRLGAAYAPLMFFLYFSMLAAVRFYRIDRAGHEANLARLRARESLAE